MAIGHLATTELVKAECGSDVIVIIRHESGYRIVNPRDVMAIKDAICFKVIVGIIDFGIESLLEVIKAIKSKGLRCAVVAPR